MFWVTMLHNIAGRHTPLPLCYVKGKRFNQFQRGFNRIRWPTIRNVQSADASFCRCERLLHSKCACSEKAGPSLFFLCMSLTCVCMCVLCVSNAKRTSAVVRVCSLAYVLIRIQSVLRADCIAAVASAAGSHGIPSPDPDSCYRCCTMLPH